LAGVIKPGTVSTTFRMNAFHMSPQQAIRCEEKLLKGMQVGDKTFKVHLMVTISPTLARVWPRRNSSTSTMTVHWSRSGTTNGKLCSQAACPRPECMAGSIRGSAIPELFNIGRIH
jgi:hypothetical protein